MPKKIISLDELSRFKDKLDVVLEDKANVDGNYPTMTVGNADALTPYAETSGAEDTTPFVFQSTGGSSDVGVKAYLRALRGNSVAWNQLICVEFTTQTKNGVTITNNEDGSITISGTATADVNLNITNYVNNPILFVKNHKYLLRQISGATENTYFWTCGYINANIATVTCIYTASRDEYQSTSANVNIKNGASVNITFYPQLFDLTLMFGAGNEPTSVLEFNRLFPKPYYEYNAGTLLSCKVNGIKNVGYNAWDEEWELGTYNITTGAKQNSSTQIRCKNFIKVIPGQTYTFESPLSIKNAVAMIFYDGNYNRISSATVNNISFTIPNDCQYVTFYVGSEYGTTYKNDMALHLTWDGSRTGYELHKEWQYELPNIELRSAGSAYDEILPTGKLIRRIGVVDLGSLTYLMSEPTTGYKIFGTNELSNVLKKPTSNSRNNYSYLFDTLGYFLIRKSVSDQYYNSPTNMSVAIAQNGAITFCNNSYTSANDFKTAMSGVYLFYELAEPTEEQTENTYQEIQDIDDFGTQEFLYDSEIAIPVPQGNEFFYPVDYKAFIDSLGGREDIEYDATAIVSQTQLAQALSTFLSSISGYDATKTQTLKNVNGVFQWVDD